MPNVNVDLIANGQAQGPVAQLLQTNGKFDFGMKRPFIDDRTGKAYVTIYRGGNPKEKSSWATIQVNAGTLRRDEWKQLDAQLMEVKRYRLGGVQDLIDKGLTYQLGNAMGTTVLEWHDVNDPGEAILSMDGITRGPNDRPVYQTNYLPIPIMHMDYQINARELAASRSLGNPLDTTMVERAARRILEKVEDLLFTDTTFAFGATDDRLRNKIYSYVNFPDRNLVNLSIPWDASAMTPAGILQDVLEMKTAMRAAYYYGDCMLYIPSNYETVLDDDYDTSTPGTTIRERIMKIQGIAGIKTVDRLPDDNVLLVHMSPDVVRLVQGLGLQNVEWNSEGGMVTNYKVMMIAVPQIRSDQNGKCGIVHLA